MSDPVALRAYLQRAEGRLATMHTIAAALIGGSALIAFTPAFFREMVVSLASQIFELFIRFKNPTLELQLIGGLFLLLLTGMLFALFLCLTSLIRQLVRLYFIPPQHRSDAGVDLVRFSLSPVAFSTDEGGPINDGELHSKAKDSILNAFFRHKYHIELIASYLRPQRIDAHNNFVRSRFPASLNQRRERFIETALSDPVDREVQSTAQIINSLSSLAGVRDRSLFEEAARTEALLTRFHLQLRILVFRYFQALLFFVVTWGAVVSLSIMFELLQSPLEEKRMMTCRYLISFALIHVWAVVFPLVTKLPFSWILAGRKKSDFGAESMFDERFVRHQRVFFRGSFVFSIGAFVATLLITISPAELSGLDSAYLDKYSYAFIGSGVVLVLCHLLLAIKFYFDALRP